MLLLVYICGFMSRELYLSVFMISVKNGTIAYYHVQKSAIHHTAADTEFIGSKRLTGLKVHYISFIYGSPFEKLVSLRT